MKTQTGKQRHGKHRKEDSALEQLKNNKPLILLLLTGAVFLFLKYISPLVTPVLAAVLFVTIFGSFLKKVQEKLHIHRQVGAILLLLTATLLLALLLWILFSWIVGSLPDWLERLEGFERDLSAVVSSLCDTVGRALRVDSAYLEGTVLRTIGEGMDYFQLKMVPGMLTQSLEYLKALGVLGGFLVTFIIASVLLAKDYDEIINRMLDREEYHVLLEVICGVIRYIATFVRAQALIMLSVGVLAAAVLAIAGIRQGVLWGILAGILDMLPFIGTSIVLFPLTAVQLFQGHYGRAAVCFLLYIACIFVREILEPRLIGKRIGVNPIAILISLYAGIQLFGLWGIIKGPLGFMLIYQMYLSIQKRWWSADDAAELPPQDSDAPI